MKRLIQHFIFTSHLGKMSGRDFCGSVWSNSQKYIDDVLGGSRSFSSTGSRISSSRSHTTNLDLSVPGQVLATGINRQLSKAVSESWRTTWRGVENRVSEASIVVRYFKESSAGTGRNKVHSSYEKSTRMRTFQRKTSVVYPPKAVKRYRKNGLNVEANTRCCFFFSEN